eukprot:11193023-Lingulodinium_polyedra.AAC.1
MPTIRSAATGSSRARFPTVHPPALHPRIDWPWLEGSTLVRSEGRMGIGSSTLAGCRHACIQAPRAALKAE